MCEISQTAKNLGKGKIDLSLTCAISGKPITVTNEYGMYCEDMCGIDEDKAATGQISKLMADFNRMI